MFYENVFIVLRRFTRENEFKRVVISTSKTNDNGNATQQFQCCPDKVYFVIGKINITPDNTRLPIYSTYFIRFRIAGNGSDDWLGLVEWLAQRGALKVVVALEKYSLTPKISRKFNILLNRYKGITIQLVSESLLSTEDAACGLLSSSTTTYPLAAVFFVSSVSLIVDDRTLI